MLYQNEIKCEKLLAKAVPEIRKFIPCLIDEIEESLHCFVQHITTGKNNGCYKRDDEHDMFKDMCIFNILSNIFNDYRFIKGYCDLIISCPNLCNEFDSSLLNGEPMKFDKISRTVMQILELIYDLMDIDKEKGDELPDYE